MRTDPDVPKPYPSMDWVKIDHDRHRVAVQIKSSIHRGDPTPADGYAVEIDTNGDSRTDFEVSIYGENEPVVFVSRVLADGRKRQVCAPRTLVYGDRKGRVRFTVPRSCLKVDGRLPAGVRLNVATTSDLDRPTAHLPARNTFGRTVRST